MMTYANISIYVGLAISLLSLIVLSTIYKRVHSKIALLLFFIFFIGFFVLEIMSSYYSSIANVAIVFETLAFLSLYYPYLKREIVFIAIPLALIGTPFYILSLYFVSYDLFVMLRRAKTGSSFIVAALTVFMISVIISIVNLAVFSQELAEISFAILDVGLLLFSVPLFTVTFGD